MEVPLHNPHFEGNTLISRLTFITFLYNFIKQYHMKDLLNIFQFNSHKLRFTP